MTCQRCAKARAMLPKPMRAPLVRLEQRLETAKARRRAEKRARGRA